MQPSRLEPSLSQDALNLYQGAEPMLGGARRVQLDRDLFWALLDFENVERRRTAIERVLQERSGKYYGARLAAVLSPGARYYGLGRLWKTRYVYEQKAAAMDSLVRCDPERALAGLVTALGNTDTHVQRAAISCIGRLPEARAEEVLLFILGDPRQEIRHTTIQALGERWNQPQVPRLINVHAGVVADAARWLGENGEARTIYPLNGALRDRWRGTDQDLVPVALVRAISRIAQRFPGLCGDMATRVLRRVLDNQRTRPVVAQEAVTALYEVGTDDPARQRLLSLNRTWRDSRWADEFAVMPRDSETPPTRHAGRRLQRHPKLWADLGGSVRQAEAARILQALNTTSGMLIKS
jgi:hypothetical protein